jgi:hypothetical protein
LLERGGFLRHGLEPKLELWRALAGDRSPGGGAGDRSELAVEELSLLVDSHRPPRDRLTCGDREHTWRQLGGRTRLTGSWDSLGPLDCDRTTTLGEQLWRTLGPDCRLPLGLDLEGIRVDWGPERFRCWLLVERLEYKEAITARGCLAWRCSGNRNCLRYRNGLRYKNRLRQAGCRSSLRCRSRSGNYCAGCGSRLRCRSEPGNYCT